MDSTRRNDLHCKKRSNSSSRSYSKSLSCRLDWRRCNENEGSERRGRRRPDFVVEEVEFNFEC